MTDRRRRLTRVAMVCAAALVLVLVLSKTGHHRTATNGIARQVSVPLPTGHALCQGGEFPGPRTGRIRFFPKAGGRRVGPFALTVAVGGTVQRRATIPAAVYEQSEAAAANFPVLARGAADAVVCIRNRGTADAAVMGDWWPGSGASALLTPGPNPAPPPWIRMHFDYQRTEASSWWSFAPTVAERFGLVKATFFGAWTMWLALVLLLGLAIGTILWASRALAR